MTHSPDRPSAISADANDILPAGHPVVPSPRIAVLITNLGTPDAPETGAVRRYLAQFLSDRRVVEIPPLLWQPILRGIILNVRPANRLPPIAKCGDPMGRHLPALPRPRPGPCKPGWDRMCSSNMPCAMGIQGLGSVSQS